LKKITLSILIALLIWTFLVCYPNPYIFLRNFIRYIRFPIDPTISELIDKEIPDDPTEIYSLVKSIVRYEYDWVNYGYPWYVPTPRDAVTRGRGDCESRAMVLASLLEHKGIPYHLRASLVHIWVEYPNKKPTVSENDEVAFVKKVNGKYRLRIPDLTQWRNFLSVEKEALWDVMPKYRKILIISGWLSIILTSLGFIFYYRHRLRL
jgi:hypothetical protein